MLYVFIVLIFPIVSHLNKIVGIVLGSVFGSICCIITIVITGCVGFAAFKRWRK